MGYYLQKRKYTSDHLHCPPIKGKTNTDINSNMLETIAQTILLQSINEVRYIKITLPCQARSICILFEGEAMRATHHIYLVFHLIVASACFLIFLYLRHITFKISSKCSVTTTTYHSVKKKNIVVKL